MLLPSPFSSFCLLLLSESSKGKANIRQKKKRRKQTKELQKKKPQNIHIVYVQKKKHTYLTIFVIYI